MLPRVHLAVDNCFASKRWTKPLEWMQIAADSGIYCVEASADNECDPLYNTLESLQSWRHAVQSASAQTGVNVVNLYSGHGTYATLGLAHTDPRIADHIQHDWLEPMIRTAAALGAGLGFFCHAFPQAVLAHPARYAAAETDLLTRLAALARVAAQNGLSAISVEQMYSPHQIPWTISGGFKLLRRVYHEQRMPLYLTLDTGHQIGQHRFRPPDSTAIEAYVAALKAGETPNADWLASVTADVKDPSVDNLTAYCNQRPYLFATDEDGDLYAWLRALGCYSPIIHLQQTDGTASAHRPFTPAYNRNGIVDPAKVLRALWDSYQQPDEPDLPPHCADLYLTLEVFSGTADYPAQIRANIRESAAYWRQYVPEDGLPLDALIACL